MEVFLSVDVYFFLTNYIVLKASSIPYNHCYTLWLLSNYFHEDDYNQFEQPKVGEKEKRKAENQIKYCQSNNNTPLPHPPQNNHPFEDVRRPRTLCHKWLTDAWGLLVLIVPNPLLTLLPTLLPPSPFPFNLATWHILTFCVQPASDNCLKLGEGKKKEANLLPHRNLFWGAKCRIKFSRTIFCAASLYFDANLQIQLNLSLN